MKKKIDWYKLLGIKRKKDVHNINEDIPNNQSIKNNNTKEKEDKNEFEKELKRLDNILNELKNKVPDIIEEKSFSLRMMLFQKLNIQSINISKEDLKSKTTFDFTINNGNIINEKVIKINLNNFDSYLNMDSKVESQPIFPNLLSININCK